MANDGSAWMMVVPGSSSASPACTISSHDPLPTATCDTSTAWRSAIAAFRSRAAPSGYRLRPSICSAMAFSTAGSGGKGLSFDASFTTESSPYADMTSAMVRPGS